MDRKILLLVLTSVALSACTLPLVQQTPLPLSVPATVTSTLFLPSAAPEMPTSTSSPSAATQTPIPPTQPQPSNTDSSAIPQDGPSGPYAVILVKPPDELNVRSGPGISNPITVKLPYNAVNIYRTGQWTKVGDSIWVEIQNPAGWVNAKFLTEYVAPSVFCADIGVSSLLQNLGTAVNTPNSELFKSLVSPTHGLDVIYIRSGMTANYSIEEAGWAFQSTFVVNWGQGFGSGQPVTGTFPEIILPALQDVFKNLHLTCNEVKLGGATYVAEWPSKYASINFYSLHNPGNDPSHAGLDWRTWLAGVEYVNGQPYLFSLLNYQWEP